MRQIHYVIQTLLRGKGSIPFKVISLGLGLAMSILLFARVAYEQSYDTCFRDYDRIYQVWSMFILNNEKNEPQTMNMGPLAGAILESFPKEVEGATCTCRYLASWPLYYGDHRFDERKLCADSLFFQTMGIEVLSGNPVQDLQQPNVIYLSKSLAERMFGGEEPVGKVISYNHERDLTVRGTFADLPDNTTVGADAVISLPPAWAATQANYSWEGGDSYYQYVRLRPGVDVEALNARMEKMTEKYLPARDSWSYSAWVQPLRDTFRQQDDVRRMFTIMLTLGLSILFITALNYALISISSLSRRAKMVGVHKCSGASGEGIFGMFMLETLVVVALALGVMFLLLWGFRDFVEDTAATKLTNLFEGSRLWVPAATVGVLLLVGGVLPGRLFARIPVTQVFRRYTEGKKGWKRPLLFVQFAGVAFICGLMCMVMMQYHFVMSKDMGFSTERIVGTYLPFKTAKECDNAYNFFRSLPYVEDLSAAYGNPLEGYSGCFINGEDGNTLFSARFDACMANYYDLMGIRLKEGRLPRDNSEVVVNETFVSLMKWGKDAVGRTVHTMGETSTVTGVLKDFQINGFYAEPMPYIGFTTRQFNNGLHFLLKEPFAENLQRLTKAAAEAFPDKTIDFTSMDEAMQTMYNPVRVFRNATAVAGVVMFFIMLMGLLGYTADEVQRRSKEIAIRKVNGAEASAILRLLGRDVLYVAGPAVAIGVAASWYVNSLWMDMFSAQASMSAVVYVLIGVAVLAVITGCVLWKSWRIANENPVLSIKSE
ncbi:ABC transporter permease [Mediterranea massiliensis]|uniref:ABC transporter permease n=1 Tax=Mediterranea massiliensis TaxID=1841865 RepID=UPI00266D32C0|nr:ABC transporter permease [Mediterranea massiliensis]